MAQHVRYDFRRMTDRQVLWCLRDTYFLQCPHQGAKNSTNQISSLSSTVRSKLSSVSSTTSFLLPAPPPLWSQHHRSQSMEGKHHLTTNSACWASIPVCCSLSRQSFHQACLWPGSEEHSELRLQWPDWLGHLGRTERELTTCFHMARKHFLYMHVWWKCSTEPW